MDNWPRIPQSSAGSMPPRSGGSSLPPPGTVIMASVEEDLGNGIYALRWAGNRISVSSRAVLSTGQSLILKSEISPEGKPTLVVQGPALPDPGEIVGRVVYGPADRRRAQENQEKQPGQAEQGAQAGREGQAGQSQGLAAGVARAALPTAGPPPISLLGLVLEPLSELEQAVATLLEAAEEEKSAWKKRLEEKLDPTKQDPKTTEKDAPAVRDLPPGEARPRAAEAAPITRLPGGGEPAPGMPGIVSAPVAAAGTASPAAVVVPLPLPAGASALPPEAILLPDLPDVNEGGEKPATEQNPDAATSSKPAADGSQPPPAPSAEQPGTVREPSPEASPPRTDAPLDRLPPSPEGAAEAPPASSETGRSRPDGTTVQAPPPEARPVDPRPAPQSDGSPPPPIADRPAGVSPPASDAAPPRAENVAVQPPVDAPAVPVPPPSSAAVPPPPDAPPAQPATAAPPEAFIKEALTQIVRVAELPLASPAADGQALGAGGGMPEAVLNKAADILLRAAGLTPDEATIEAAKALIENNVQVERQAVQAMLALSAGAGPDERAAMLRAAARLIARDIPLAAPIAGGMADVLERRMGVDALLDRADASLAAADFPAAEPALAAAREMLNLLRVDLGGEDAALALERYVSTFGREALAKALALVERAAQAALETHPLLPRLDAAITAILTLLEQRGGLEGGAGGTTEAAAGGPSPDASMVAEPPEQGGAPDPGSTPASPGTSVSPGAGMENSAPPIVGGVPAPAVSGVATPEAPAADGSAPLPVPPAVPPEATGVSPQPRPLPQPGAQPTGTQPDALSRDGQAPERLARLMATGEELAPDKARILDGVPGREAAPSGSGTGMADGAARAALLARLESILQIPGLNRPEIELLRPSGFLDRSLEAGGDGAAKQRAAGEGGRLARDLLSDDPGRSEQALRDLPKRDAPALRDAAARLTRAEAEILRSDPLVSRLSDAASSIRDLGRQLLAVKAENVAGQNREPGVMLAEVPFKLAEDAGDGRMQMFYRRSSRKDGGWTSRVILDLNTTVMGPVLGDMRFFGQDMTLNMFVEKPETARFLAQSADDLAEALSDKGFRLKSRFMVLPPPPPPPEIRAERPQEIAGAAEAATPAVPPARRGRLDIRG